MRQMWGNDVSASSGISSPEQVVNQNNLLGALCKNVLFPHFLFFLFSNVTIRRADFTNISA